jgi:predicted site-specific integrase-resolvase
MKTRELQLTLQVWAQQQWGEHAPSIFTLRAWARSGKIYPMPKKVGRIYFVRPNAEYIRNINSLVHRMREVEDDE